MTDSMSKNKYAIIFLVIGVVFIGTASAYYLLGSIAEEPIDWDVTLIGSDGEQKVLTYQEIRNLPSHEACGGYLTTAGIVYGPYEVKGVFCKTYATL